MPIMTIIRQRVGIAVTLLIRIRKVLSSNFGRPGHRNFFCEFPKSLVTNGDVVHGLGHDRFLSHPFQFIIRLSSRHWLMYRQATISVQILRFWTLSIHLVFI
jgi:hypothetical protein